MYYTKSDRLHEPLIQLAPNSTANFLQVDPAIANCVRLIDVSAYRPGQHLELVMDDEKGVAMAFLAADPA